MNTILVVYSLLATFVNGSSRVGCTPSDNEFCERYDYEGACCAKLTVQEVNSEGSLASEVVGQVLYKCYDIDDIITAFDNTDVSKFPTRAFLYSDDFSILGVSYNKNLSTSLWPIIFTRPFIYIIKRKNNIIFIYI